MNRIAKKFQALKKKKQKAFIAFMTAGHPNLKKNEKLIYAFEEEGVDLIELGVPFSDPLADGPTIQESSVRALRKNVSLTQILTLAQNVRKKSQIPLVIMSYLNPILQYGFERFAKAAKRSGIDGVIVPDLPPEEGKALSKVLRQQAVDPIYLVAPTSTPKRRASIVKASRGFVYYVSLTGVTGIRSLLPVDIRNNILKLKRQTKLPVCVGFGISQPQQARNIARVADGIIVGSAIVKSLLAHPHLPAKFFARQFIRPFAQAIGRGK